jgi:hypothetical protein
MLQKKGIKCPNILMDGKITMFEDHLKVQILQKKRGKVNNKIKPSRYSI